jgi:putative ABC transport system permease protein
VLEVEGLGIANGATIPPASFDGTPEFFRTVGLPILQGRSFTDADRPGNLPVVIVNTVAAERFWPEQDPIGKRLRIAPHSPNSQWLTVVGVAASSLPMDEVYLANVLRRPKDVPVIFRPLAQTVPDRLVVGVRVLSRPAGAVPFLRRAISTIEPNALLENVTSMQQRVFDRPPVRQVEDGARLLGAFGLIGAMLALAGVYGAVTEMMQRRTTEFGVRIALGASPRQVFALGILSGIRLALSGIVIGAVLGAVLERVMGSALSDSVNITLGSVIAAGCLLVVAAVLAVIVPARAMMRIDPSSLLRDI